MNIEAIQELARRWRDGESSKTGYVVIFNGDVAGWKRELDNPQGWEPGCLAVSPEGDIYQAESGNAYDGAQQWKLYRSCETQESVSQQALKTEAGRAAIEDLFTVFAYGELSSTSIRQVSRDALDGDLLRRVFFVFAKPSALAGDHQEHRETKIRPLRPLVRRFPQGAQYGFQVDG